VYKTQSAQDQADQIQSAQHYVPYSSPIGSQSLLFSSQSFSQIMADQSLPIQPSNNELLFPNSQMPAPNSQLPAPLSQIPVPNSQLLAPLSQMPVQNNHKQPPTHERVLQLYWISNLVRNYSVNLMLEYYSFEELIDPATNVTGRAPNGANFELRPIDPVRMDLQSNLHK